MSYLEHAKREFRAAGWTNEHGEFTDEMQKLMCGQVLDLLELFSSHGHSGSSAPYAIGMFEKLAKFEPIGPITGAESEWVEVGNGLLQNSRCSHVFKDAGRFDGKPFDSQAVVFYDWYVGEDGKRRKSSYTSSDSARVIEFPYTPKSEYMERP